MRGTTSDPFAALDSNSSPSTATDDISARFPSLDQFSLLHDKGAKFEFDATSPVMASKTKDLSQRVTEKLADDAFVSPQYIKATVPSRQDVASTSGMSRAQKIISSSPALQEAISTPSAPVTHPTPQRPAMVSEGTMTSPTELPLEPQIRKYTPSPIHRFPRSDHHRSSSLPRSPGLSGAESRNLKPDSMYPPRGSGSRDFSFQPQPNSHAKHASSSRPSLEGGRPSSDLLDTVSRTQSTESRPRPATTYLESNLDYLRERESATSKSGFLNRQTPPQPSPTQVETSNELKFEEDSKIESEVDFLRTMEDQDAGRRRDRRKSSGDKQAKRSSLPSMSLSGTKNLLAGKFGDAFKRFENNTSAPPALRTPSPERALTGRDLTPIAGSEATDGRSDDGQMLEETEDMPPEMKRELERRRLSMEEKRVADAAAEYRKRLAERDAGGAPKSIGGITKAASIQRKVKNLLDENQKPVPTKKTAEGYGRYTDVNSSSQARMYDEKPVNPYPKPVIARKPVMPSSAVGSPSNPRLNPSSTATSSTYYKATTSMSTTDSLPHRSATLASRPSAPPKPSHLNSLPTGPSASSPSTLTHSLSNSPPKPSLESRRIEPRPDMTQAEKADYIADFSKRFPSLSGIEMVETVVGDEPLKGGSNGRVKDP